MQADTKLPPQQPDQETEITLRALQLYFEVLSNNTYQSYMVTPPSSPQSIISAGPLQAE